MPKSAKKENDLLLPALTGTLVLLALSVVNIEKVRVHPKVLAAQAVQASEPVVDNQEIHFWQGFLAENPTYSPGWIELAKLHLLNNHKAEARSALNHAKALDPNSDGLKLLEKEIGS